MAKPYWRKDRKQYYIRVKDAEGTWRNLAAGKSLRAAEQLQRTVEAGIAAHSEQRPAGPLVRDVAEERLARREARGLRNVRTERSYTRNHVLPYFGDWDPRDVRKKDVRGFVESLMAKDLAPRTVCHIHEALYGLFADLEEDEIIDRNPCKLKRGTLPKKRDKDPAWRAGAVFTRREAEILISHRDISHYQRVTNAIFLFTGVRFGEFAALRFRHIHQGDPPLPILTVAHSYFGGTKTDVSRIVPVHPALSMILAEWRLHGWAKLVGREPTDDDFMVPSKKGTMKSRTPTYDRLQKDLEALGMRRRRIHDMRRTFITLARSDGADDRVLKQITHGASGEIIDLYTTFPYRTYCEAILCLKLRRPSAKVSRIDGARGAS